MSSDAVIRHLLAVERGELGTAESPHGSNKVKYNTAFYGRPVHNTGGLNYAWCVTFQWWCFQRAGISTAVFPKTANVFAVRDWYKKRNRFDHHPRVGSLVIFSFSHIGLVEKVLSGGRVQTVEGNTDLAGGRTGGKVMRKIRSRGILGYCHPDYAAVKPVVHQPDPKPVKPPARPPVPAGPAHTAVEAHDVIVPAGEFVRVPFDTAVADTARFWTPPKDGAGGFSLATGPGLFIGDVSLQAPAQAEGATLAYRLIQADQAPAGSTSRSYPEATFQVGATPAADHRCTTSQLDPGGHLMLEVYCTETVTLPLVRVEVVMLSRS